MSELIQQSRASMECLQRAAAVDDCDWGLDFSAGPNLMMPHLSKARQMGRFAVLHARQHFAESNEDAAVDAIGHTFVLARHTGVDNVLIWHQVVLVLRRSRYSYSYSNEASMTEPIFDHDRLDVYRLSIDYVASSFTITRNLDGLHRHARDQWLRAAQSISPNVAEGNRKRSLKDRNRFLDIARLSALECVAIQDILAATDGLHAETHRDLKRVLHRIGSMLMRLIGRADLASESDADYYTAGEYEYRDAEYEYEYEGIEKPEIEIGARIALGPLSDHRTSGSAYGGSAKRSKLDPELL